jgi:hypothetical protein
MKLTKQNTTIVEIQIGEGDNFFLKTCEFEPDRVTLHHAGTESNDYIARFCKEDFQEFINGCQAYLDNAEWEQAKITK